MNQVLNRPRTASPFRAVKRDPFDITDKKHPVNVEIQKCTGTFNLTAEIKPDNDTASLFKSVKGLIAFICELRLNNEIVGVGRGTSVMSKSSRYVEKSVRFAWNASLIDAIVRCSKLEVLSPYSNTKAVGEVMPADYQEGDSSGYQQATPKQISYLNELIANIADEDEQSRWLEQLSSYSKSDASEAIQALKK